MELNKTTTEIVNITATLFRRCGGGSAGAEQQHTTLKVGMGAGGGRISPCNDGLCCTANIDTYDYMIHSARNVEFSIFNR